jgi:hypothetical protein
VRGRETRAQANIQLSGALPFLNIVQVNAITEQLNAAFADGGVSS